MFDRLDQQTFSEVLNLCLSELQSNESTLTATRVLKLSNVLGIPAEDVENSLNALIKAILDTGRGVLSLDSLCDCVPEMHRAALRSATESSLADIRSLISQKQRQHLSVDQFVDVDWRLECEIASRCCRNQCQPQFTVQLITSNSRCHRVIRVVSLNLSTGSDAHKQQLLQCDYGTMQRLVDELDRAVKESQSKHFNRLSRQLR